jgi:cytochrome c peroxidase
MTPSIPSRNTPRSRAQNPQGPRAESSVLRGALRPPTLGRAGFGLAAVLLGGLALACGGVISDDEALLTASENLSQGPAQSGARLFDRAFPHSNGRSCATCHVHQDHTTLSPDHVAELLASDPDDPLFNALDADDPGAAQLTYQHLAKGLVRVVLHLADNVDIIDAAGQVITAPDRRLEVWRAVPSVANSAITAPYQYDGRAPTLQDQAQGAIIAHSQGGPVRPEQLDRIAQFEQTVFTSGRARLVYDQLERGVPLDQIRVPEEHLRLSASEQRGRTLYNTGCAPCHGGATTRQITSQVVHDSGFFALGPDGYVEFDVKPGAPPVPVLAPHANDGFLAGYSVLSYFGQIGALPTFNASVTLPQYRLRFYTDATREHALTELPPAFVTLSGDPTDPRPAVDANGAPLVGPNFLPQAFTTDPGRAAITGDPLDFEAFDVPQLRGIAHTAPYFHDNAAATLLDVVDIYSRFVLGVLPSLNLPPVNPPELPGAPPEALSPAQKQDLLAFLTKL